MNSKENTYGFLRSNGFNLTESDRSPYFGDYYDVFANDCFQLRFSSDRSFEAVDIRSNQPSERWFDLALVKALLYEEHLLNKVTTIEESLGFLQKEFASIADLFDERNYPATKRKLEELGNEKVKQIFPGIRE